MTERNPQNPKEPTKKPQTLQEMYEEANKKDLFIREFKAPKGFIASVGALSTLKEGIDPKDIPVGDLMYSSIPGHGNSREEAVQNAMDAYTNFKKREQSKTHPKKP